ncbi:hypothetical protein ACTXT7_011872 [Hymenolepis weldensis]
MAEDGRAMAATNSTWERTICMEVSYAEFNHYASSLPFPPSPPPHHPQFTSVKIQDDAYTRIGLQSSTQCAFKAGRREKLNTKRLWEDAVDPKP